MKAPELKERLEESEKLIQEMTESWEEKLRKTEEIAQVRLSRKQVCARVMSLAENEFLVCRRDRSSWKAWAFLCSRPGSESLMINASWSI